jgi:aromatic ring-opening dioxygenase catalytic subunit (LigB family)
MDYGFPAETYALHWPAPGSPALADRVADLLQNSGLPVASDSPHGLDHGIFVPLKVAFPDANIPVVPLSLAGSLDPAFHLAVGNALAHLRDEGVLVAAGAGGDAAGRRVFQDDPMGAVIGAWRWD